MRVSLVSLVILAACSICLPAMAEDQLPAGFVSMFNGKDLTGWDGAPDLWSVKDGVINGQTTAEKPLKHNSFLIWKGGRPADFEMHVKFKFCSDWGNSGIQIRSKELGDWAIGGYQPDCDTTQKYTGALYEERGRGILALRCQKVVIDEKGKKNVVGPTDADPKQVADSIKKDGWNEYVIIAEGNHIVQKLNGFVTVDLTDNQVDKRAMEGVIALQLHAGKPMLVQFKDLSIKITKDGAKQ